ncbi:lysophospholipid acyltransferase family protein [Luminiphilus syltensis]|uniref:lysophospholipid acyltransferase family protein n=1 Tax=Luminiphilus syltensis TaxID=1341119 RepID=UPI00058C67E6|nr:lysophospholipid acyltransferase family protein [Luminiphilus syltensis]
MIYRLYCLVATLPLRVKYALASAGAWLLFHLFRYRRATVERNIRASFPDQSEGWHRQTIKAFYNQLAQTAMEIIHSRRMSLAQFEKRMVIANPEVMERATAGGSQSAIVMTIHQGNWEWMLHSATAHFGYDMAPVYKRLHSPGADRFALESRSQFGATPVLMADAARNILKHRRTPRVFIMVADQSPGQRERAYWTDFLNQPTAFFTGAAAIARLTGFPVIFAQCERQRRGFYTLTFHEVSAEPKKASEDDIIERYVRLAELAVKADPSSYLWSNRRWKLDPPQAEADNDSGGEVLAATEIQSKPSD